MYKQRHWTLILYFHQYLERRHSHVNLHTPLKPLGTSSSHSHHHHSKKDKGKKGHKKKRHHHDDTGKRKSPEKQRTVETETDQGEVTPLEEPKDVVEVESLETNLETENIDIVDQTISILPEITEHVILSTPPTHSFLSEQPEPTLTDTGKETKVGRHKKKHDNESYESPKAKGAQKSGSHHKHRHRHKLVKLKERRRTGAGTLTENDKRVQLDPSKVDEEEDTVLLDTKDAEDMTCEYWVMWC